MLPEAIEHFIKDHVTSEEVCKRIREAIGDYDEQILFKKRKLRWFGHVSRSSALAKTILQDTVKGKRKRKRGRQKERWEDSIREWTGIVFASSTRAAEKRTRWKGIHLWCPDDLPRLWDRIYKIEYEPEILISLRTSDTGLRRLCLLMKRHKFTTEILCDELT